MDSILQNKEKCYICGEKKGLCTHHIFFGTANRKISDENGFTVRLCWNCHTGGGNGECVHQCREMDLQLKRDCQRKYEETHSRDEFIRLIGRNYL